MIEALVLAALVGISPIQGDFLVCLDPSQGGSDETLQELYESGRAYTDFLERATRRAELWHGNTQKSEGIDQTLVERARAVQGTWRFLAIAIDSCSDSVSTIPYLAQLVSLVDGLDMRIIDPTAGRSIMEAHPTPDGRAATPTVLLLDDDFEEVGCFIERPPLLQTWLLEKDRVVPSGDLHDQKMEWYADDAGNQTVQTFVAMLEAAAAGSTVCG